MKRFGGTDAIDLFMVVSLAFMLCYSALMTGDVAIRLLCIAVFLYFLLSRRKTKTVKAQLIEIVDENGNSRACIGYAAGGLSMAIRKADINNNVCIPLSLLERGSFVQFTMGSNLGSTDEASDRTSFIHILDSSREKIFRIGLVYPRGRPAEAKRVYYKEDTS